MKEKLTPNEQVQILRERLQDFFENMTSEAMQISKDLDELEREIESEPTPDKEELIQ